MIQHVVIAVIFFFVGMAWGWGMHGMMVANARRKRILAARAERITFITDPRREVENGRSYKKTADDYTGATPGGMRSWPHAGTWSGHNDF